MNFDDLIQLHGTNRRKFIQLTKNPDAFRGLHGETLLHFCSIENLNECVEDLIRLGANVNLRSKYGSSPLMDAALVGNDHIVKLLLSAGADVAAQDATGYTVMDKLILLGKTGPCVNLIKDASS